MQAQAFDDAIFLHAICSQGVSDAARIVLTKDKARALATWLLEVAS